MNSASDVFTAEHWQYLTGPLRLTGAAKANERSLSVAALTDAERCRALLDRLSPIIGSPSRRVTASLLSKRLAFLLTGACLYALTAADRGLDVSAENCMIDVAHDGERWISRLPLQTFDARTWVPAARERARTDIVATLFTGLIAPLWQVLHQVSGVPMRMLWENTAVRVYSLYERRMADFTSPAAIARRDADWQFLLSAPPALFGWSVNPLARFLQMPTSMDDGRSVRFRRTCCLYFKATRPPEYCRTCPLLQVTPGDRPGEDCRDTV